MSDVKFAPDFEGMPPPNLFIQWKGTDLCGDFRCECGSSLHIDAMFVYAIKCADCGAEYATPHTVALKKIEPGSEQCLYVSPDEE